MSNIGYRIIQNIKRPPKDTVLAFKDIQTSNIGDCMNRSAAISSKIKPLNDNKLLGPALTVNLSGGDNLLFYVALDMAKEGDIIVVAGGGYTERALCGEIMAKYAKSKNIGGFLIDGAVRDIDILSNMDFPIFALGASPNGPYKNGPGEINVPVSIGGKVVFPGDIVVGDSDGVVIVKPDEAENVLEDVEKVISKEAILLENIRNGKGLDIQWVYKKLEENKCEFI